MAIDVYAFVPKFWYQIEKIEGERDTEARFYEKTKMIQNLTNIVGFGYGKWNIGVNRVTRNIKSFGFKSYDHIEIISHHLQNWFFALKFHIDDYWAPIVLNVYMGANEITWTKIEASIL